MLKSKHRFIKQGDLTYNDNGNAKFNKSEIRYIDERLMEWVSSVNDKIENSILQHKGYLVLVESKLKSFFYKYTQIGKVGFEKVYSSANELKNDTDHNVFYVFLGSIDDYDIDIAPNYIFLAEEPLSKILDLSTDIPYGDQVNDYLINNILNRLKVINDTLETIKKDEKVIIYGGGYQTEEFLRYANISRLDIINIVDINEVYVFNKKTDYPRKEVLDKADVVLVTPFFAAKQIKKYLQDLDIKVRIIMLKDLCGEILFTSHKNIWAPNETELPYELNMKETESKNTLLDIVKSVNTRSDYFVSIKVNEPYAIVDYTDCCQAHLEFNNKSSIVVQGPIVRKNDFTLETIRLYNKNFPNVKIILSTWENELSSEDRRKFSTVDVDVVTSPTSEVRGYQNTNLQLITTYAGLKRAKELGNDYALKTRTDMRIYSPELLRFMYVYMKNIKYNVSHKQKERLIIFPPRYDYFFFIPDFFMFGNISDLMNYWNVEDLFSNSYIGEAAETMLGQRYAKYLGCNIENNLTNIKDYGKIINRYFGVLDDRLIYCVWYKYFYYKPWDIEYKNNILNFSDWIKGQIFI